MATSQQCYEAYRIGGKTSREIAAALGCTPSAVRGQSSRYAAELRKQSDSPKPAVSRVPLETRQLVPFPEIQTYVYTGTINPVAVPVFTGEWRLNLSELAIIGDLHAVATNRAIVEQMCLESSLRMRGERNLLIAGDALNGDKDSKHAKHVPPIPRAQELRFMRELFDYLFGYFDRIWVTPGNHIRNRLIELLEGDLDTDQIKSLLTTKPNRLEYSPYDVVHVQSGGVDWTITHQYQYSRRKLVIANQLAQKYQTNICTFHQHHTAQGMDDYGRYVCIDCGGGHEDEMFSYARLVPNTMPRMNRAWVFLRAGTAHLITPYQAWGDFTKAVSA